MINSEPIIFILKIRSVKVSIFDLCIHASKWKAAETEISSWFHATQLIRLLMLYSSQVEGCWNPLKKCVANSPSIIQKKKSSMEDPRGINGQSVSKQNVNPKERVITFKIVITIFVVTWVSGNSSKALYQFLMILEVMN